VDGSRLLLYPRRGTGDISATEFLIIRWGLRVYLIPHAKMAEFCDAVESGAEPRTDIHGAFYLSRDDVDTIPSGLPDVPHPWRSRLPVVVVRGRVTELIDRNHIRIDLGTNSGVAAGTRLRTAWLTGVRSRTLDLVVREVSASSCVVRLEFPIDLPLGHPVALSR
jgi:hypothetical protein